MQATSQGSGTNILLIDSEPIILKLLDMMLSEQDFTVHCASSPVEALAMCQAHSPQLVLADVDFWGEGGPQLLASIRAMSPGVHICLMTAGLPSCTDDELQQLQVLICFSKPTAIPKLVTALKQLSLLPPARACSR